MEPTQVLEKCVAAAHRRPTLRLGSRGAMVHEWQVLMQREMRAALKPTGVFDNDTRRVTMAFQRKAGIQADGIVGPRTWAAAAVAPCYALAVAAQKSGAKSGRTALMNRPSVPATHGLGVMGLSFSVLDVKSMVLGGVLGLGLGAVLFRRK